MIVLIDGKQYSYSYAELREHYIQFCDLSDKEFLERLPEILHLACAICFFKEIPNYICLADDGIIHELVHLLHIPEVVNIVEIRNQFKQQLKLS